MNNKSMQSILIFLVLICAKTQGVSVSEHFNLVQIGINEFFATRNVPTYFKKATAPFLMPNLFRHGIEFELNICDENVCSICEQISNGFINLKREQVPSNVTTDIAVKLCVAFGIENERVCQGTVERNMVVLDYMVENKPDITGRKLCAYTMYSNNCFPDEVTEWSIEVPKGSSPPRSEAKNSETFKILHLSDFHYDALYTPKGNSECGEPMCCQPDQAPPTQESDTCGYWHTYKNADSPLHTILATLNQTTTHDFDFVYYTGDVIAHRSWSTTIESNSRDIRLIFDSLKKYYNVPVYAVMGNHEPTPANVWVDSNVTDESVSMQWLFDVWAECMSDWLPDSAIETVKKGGYFTVSPKPGLRLVALNNNACYMANWWLPFNDFDSYGQLQWLTQVLQDAETNKESVHMIYHLPTGSDSCLKSWSIAYKQILERFANTIVGQFAGHTHHDEFMVYFNKSEVPIGVSHNGASVTTFMNSNPSYKLFDINRETFEVENSQEWTFNLTAANLQPDEPLNWYKLYDFKDAFGVKNLGATEMGSLLYRLAVNKTLLDTFQRFRFRDGDEVTLGCDDDCHKDILCILSTSENGDLTQCKYFMEIYDQNNRISLLP